MILFDDLDEKHDDSICGKKLYSTFAPLAAIGPRKSIWPVGQDLCPSSRVQEVEASFLDPLLLCLKK